MDDHDHMNNKLPPDIGSDWESLTRGRPFVTDLGFVPNYLQPMPGGPPMAMGRYSVFLPVPGEARHQIVEVSSDIAYLKQKYEVPDWLVFVVGAPLASQG